MDEENQNSQETEYSEGLPEESIPPENVAEDAASDDESDDTQWAPPEVMAEDAAPDAVSEQEPVIEPEPVASGEGESEGDIVDDGDMEESAAVDAAPVGQETEGAVLLVHEAETDAIPVDDFDISAALAAVASLDQLTADDASLDQFDDEEYDFEEQGDYVPADPGDDIEPFERTTTREAMPGPALAAGYTQTATIAHPDMFTMRRGQVASVLPALLLIGIGAWLTFVTTTADTALPVLDGATVLVLLVGVVGVALLAHWWASRRWARGNFFISLSLVFVSLVAFFLLQPNQLGLQEGWPLLFSGLGLAMMFTGLLTQPRSGGLAANGLLVIILGAVATTVTARLLPEQVLSMAADIWPVAIVILVIMLLVPVIRR